MVVVCVLFGWKLVELDLSINRQDPSFGGPPGDQNTSEQLDCFISCFSPKGQDRSAVKATVLINSW